jgi:hypothetical protein
VRIVFLDIDGVLATSGTYKRARVELVPQASAKPLAVPTEGRGSPPVGGATQAWGSPTKTWTHPGEDLLCADLAANVQELCVKADARIVLSTSWRNLHPLETLKGWLAAKGLTTEIVGVTPDLFGKRRGMEIDAWMAENGRTAPDIVILEDEEDVAPYRGRQIQTCFNGPGFTRRHLARALRLWGLTVSDPVPVVGDPPSAVVHDPSAPSTES